MKAMNKIFATISVLVLLLTRFSSHAQTCPGSLGTPIYINSFPYTATGLTTCGKGSSIDVHENALLCAEVWNYYGEDQTFIFTPAATDSVAIILKANIPHTTMTLYAGCPFNGQGGTCVAFVGDQNSANPPFKGMLIQLTAGITYYLLIDNTGIGGVLCIPSYDLSIITQPSNDDCGSAITLTPGSICNPVSGNTYAASRTLPVPNECGGSVDDDVWYKFTATSTSHTVTVDPIDPTPNIDMVVDVRDGGYTGTNIACSYLGDTYGVTEVIELTNLTVGHTYYVRVYTDNNTVEYRGYFNICVTTPAAPPPANNNCSGGVELTIGGAPVSGNTAGATQSLPPVTCNGIGNADDDVWYHFTTASPSFTVTASSATLDLVVDVRAPAGDCNGSSITCINNTGAGGTESAAVTAVNGILTYYVRVYSFNAATGPFTISVSIPTPPPACLASPTSPTHGQSGLCSGSQLTLTWPAQSGATSYDLYFGTTATPPFAANVAGTSYTTATLSAGTYYWQVRPKNVGGTASGCAVWNFTVNQNGVQQITCPANVTVAANASCQASLAAYQPVSVTGCGAQPTISQLPAAGTTLNLGASTVTLRATDAAANTTTCSFTVTVADQTVPTITCPANTTVSANGSCQSSVGNYASSAVSSDNCTASPTKTQTPTAGTIIGAGATTVTLRATDSANNSSTCSFTVTVRDQTVPGITCPANISQAAPAGQCSANVTFANATATDNCTASPTIANLGAASGSSFTGVTSMTFRATDAAGNSATCSFTISITETTPPTINCPANTTVSTTAACQASLSNYAAAATAMDNCTASPVKTQSPIAGTLIGLGATTVTLRATDAGSNSATCSFAVTVTDQTLPNLTCPANTTVAANVSCSGVLGSYTALSVSDNCAANPTVTQSPAAGTALSGHNDLETVTLTASDGNGNSRSCTFTVTLKDMTLPTITCPANATITATVSCGGVLGSYPAVAVSDNCSASPTVTQNPAAGMLINDGGTVTLTANDGNGNTQNCTFTVTVIDIGSPTVVCKPFTAVLNTSGLATITTANVFQSGADNCGAINQVSVVPNTFDCSSLGARLVILTVNDGNGNTGACQATVTVSDQSPPIANCRKATVYLDDAGQATILADEVHVSSSDNCSVAGMTVTPSIFSCAQVGENTVTLTVTDAAGNQGTCNSTVQVEDLIEPVAKCKDFTLHLGTTGSVSAALSAFDNGSSDNCSIDIVVDQSVFTCADLGKNEVTLSVYDPGGNKSSCISLVQVIDAIPPVASCKNATLYLNASGVVLLTAAAVNNGSSDNCGIQTMELSKKQFNCSNVGTNTVTLQTMDAGGNAASCTATVTVADNLAPAALCQNKTVSLSAGGSVTVQSAILAAGSSDNCTVSSFTPATKVYNASNMGANNLLITVRDNSGNTSTCTSVVTVVPFGTSLLVVQPGSNGGQDILESTHVDISEVFDLKVYPNPTAADATLGFELPASQPYQFYLYDLNGRVVQSGEGEGVKGENSLSLETGRFMPGIYLLEFRSGEWKGSQRVMVQK